jgi:hypothetical protein
LEDVAGPSDSIKWRYVFTDKDKPPNHLPPEISTEVRLTLVESIFHVSINTSVHYILSGTARKSIEIRLAWQMGRYEKDYKFLHRLRLQIGQQKSFGAPRISSYWTKTVLLPSANLSQILCPEISLHKTCRNSSSSGQENSCC